MFFMSAFGLGLAVVSLCLGRLLESTSYTIGVQFGAFLLVFGGTLGAVIAQSSKKDSFMGMQLLHWLLHPPVTEREERVQEIVGWARIAQRGGTLQLDRLAEAISDPMLKSGVEMIVDRYDPEYIRDTLLTDVHIRD